LGGGSFLRNPTEGNIPNTAEGQGWGSGQSSINNRALESSDDRGPGGRGDLERTTRGTMVPPKRGINWEYQMSYKTRVWQKVREDSTRGDGGGGGVKGKSFGMGGVDTAFDCLSVMGGAP